MSAVQTERDQRILRARTHTEAAQPALLPALALERRRMLEARLRAAQADTRPIRTSTRNDDEKHYSGRELAEPAVRSGADEHMGLPSRRGDWLYYRDGRVANIDWDRGVV